MAITSGRNFWCLCSSILLVVATPLVAAETKLFESVQVTPASEYTFGIEGPAADLDGNLFVVNFGKPGTIGRLPAGGAASEAFTALPEGSVGNAIRFDRNGTMFIADYKKHNIFAIPKGSTEPGVWFHSDEMNQPNDITIAARRRDLCERSELEGPGRPHLAHCESRRWYGAGTDHVGAARDGDHQRHRSEPRRQDALCR